MNRPDSEITIRSPGNTRGQPFGRGQVGHESVQIAVVDPQKRRAQAHRAVQLRVVMHLDQRIHPPVPRGILQLGGLPVLDRAMMIRMQSAPQARASATW